MDKYLRRISVALIAANALCFATTGFASGYPDKPITLIVPFLGGGGADQWARIYALKLSDKLGVPVIVENRAGANTQIGANRVAKAQPDGYTLLFTSATHIQLPALYPNLPYDIPKDFSAVSQLGTTGLMFVAPSEIKVNNIEAFSAKSKQAGNYSLGTYAVGSAGDVFGNYLSKIGGLNAPTIAYKGETQAIIDVVSGRIQGGFFSLPLVKPFIKSGQITALGILSNERSPAFPNVQTMVEQGYKDFNWPGVWIGVFAPAQTSKEVINKLAAATKEIVDSPEVHESYAQTDLVTMWRGPEEFSNDIKRQMALWKKLVDQLGVSVQ